MKTKYYVAAELTLAGLDNFQGIMTAKKHQEIFGRNIFGRKRISIDTTNQGRVFGSFKVAFGMDFQTFEFSFAEIADLMNDPSKLVKF